VNLVLLHAKLGATKTLFPSVTVPLIPHPPTPGGGGFNLPIVIKTKHATTSKNTARRYCNIFCLDLAARLDEVIDYQYIKQGSSLGKILDFNLVFYQLNKFRRI